MNSRILAPLLFAGVGALGGMALNAAVVPSRRSRALERTAAGAPSPAPGSAVAVVGGFRSLAADLAWIQLHGLWHSRNLPAAETLVHAVSILEPGSEYFWLNGARIIAYDLTVWRVGEKTEMGLFAPREAEMIAREQAWRALDHLRHGLTFHPRSAAIWIERASLEFSRLHQPAAAAESFRRAASCPGAPGYATRLHAEMLRRAGRPADALASLMKTHAGLPPGTDPASAALLLSRIRDLEVQLEVPPLERYRPTGVPDETLTARQAGG